MNVQNTGLIQINGVMCRYKHSRVHKELPAIKMQAKKWFLWVRTLYGWDYVGYFDTKAEMLLWVPR